MYVSHMRCRHNERSPIKAAYHYLTLGQRTFVSQSKLANQLNDCKYSLHVNCVLISQLKTYVYRLAVSSHTQVEVTEGHCLTSTSQLINSVISAIRLTRLFLFTLQFCKNMRLHIEATQTWFINENLHSQFNQLWRANLSFMYRTI